MPNNPCLSPAMLTAFLEESLPPQAREPIAAHLEGCPRCLQACASLAEGASLRAMAARPALRAIEAPTGLHELRERIYAYAPPLAGIESGPQALANPATMVLEVVAGPRAGARFEFNRHETFLVGRGPGAHLQLLDDLHFSRSHFLLELNPPACYLRDLRSRNGTFVNGQRVREAFLRHGDMISGGETRIRFFLLNKPELATISSSLED